MSKDFLSEYDTTAANNTTVGSINSAEGWAPSVVNNAFREIMSHLALFRDNFEKGADISSATALLVNIPGMFHDVTGTTTITSFADTTNDTSLLKVLQFDGALTLTHHVTNLILPGGVNITTAAGDIGVFYRYATADWRLINYMTKALPAIPFQNYVDKNPIINGDFNSWQEGNPAAALGNGEDGTYFADLWAFSENGSPADEWTITQDTSVPTVAQSGHLSTSSLKAVCATDSTGNDSADATSLHYVIEGYEWQPYAQQIFTLSFWHKHTVTGTHSVVFANTGRNLEYGAEYNQAVTNTWEKATITVAVADDGSGTWNYTTGRGLELLFCLSAGSNRTFAAASTWADHSGDATFQHGTDDCVDNASAAANVFQIAQIKIDKGAVALPFIGRNHQEELDRIYRYFYRIDNSEDVNNWTGFTGAFQSTTVSTQTKPHPVPMRAVPTFAVSNVADFAVLSQTASLATTNVVNNDGSSTVAGINVTSASTGDGNGAVLRFDGTADRHLEFDARL